MANLDRAWHVVEDQFVPEKMGHYEALFTLGNGYIGVRGATEEDYRQRASGVFLAGLFDKANREVTELPNLPDWIGVEIYLGGERFDLCQGQMLDYSRTLDMKNGLLRRSVVWQSPQGQVTSLQFERFVSLDDIHLMGLQLKIIPLNYDGEVNLLSIIDGQVTNSGTQHLTSLEHCTYGERGIYLVSETNQSHYTVIQAAHHSLLGEITNEGFRNDRRQIEYWVELTAEKEKEIVFEKLVSVYTSRDPDFLPEPRKIQDLLEYTLEASLQAVELSYDSHKNKHQLAWHSHWEQGDVKITGNDFDQLAVRFAIFHLIGMNPWHDWRVSIAAKGLSGEGYKGHVFWDTDIFMFPYFLYNFPAAASNLLMYRYHTLAGAMKKAQDNGYQGAMYAWESADTGEETTPRIGAIDLKTRKPIPILCGDQEQHITGDVAYALIHYYQATADQDFMEKYGCKILFLTARYWASRVTYNEARDCYEINGVIGPDEYKEHVSNNYYTNSLAKFNLEWALRLFKLWKDRPRVLDLSREIGLSELELDKWVEIARKIRLPRQGKQLWQFDGFAELNHIDVLEYRNTPGALQKEYSWEEITNAQILKQADVIMLLYLLGDQFTLEEKRVNWDFYEPRTMHDSSLSAAIHSIVAADIGLVEQAYAYYSKAARIDLGNELGNSAAGLHAASLGGLWQATVHGFGGLRLDNGMIVIRPRLPEKWEALSFSCYYRGTRLQVLVTHDAVEVTTLASGLANEVRIDDSYYGIPETNQTLKIRRQKAG